MLIERNFVALEATNMSFVSKLYYVLGKQIVLSAGSNVMQMNICCLFSTVEIEN
jgi:hypothetical protein